MKEEDLFEEHRKLSAAEDMRITLEVPATSDIKKLRDFAQRTFGEELSTFKAEEIAYTRTQRVDDLVCTIAIARAESEELYGEFDRIRKDVPTSSINSERTSELETVITTAEELVANLQEAELAVSRISEIRDRMRQM
jgi:hypothetical protein